MKLKNLLISVGAFALVSSFAVGLAVSHDEMTRTEAANSKTLYLSPNANWKVDNARFAAYFFGNGETWLSMTDEDTDGIYEVEAPSGYPSVIFCRMNPSAAANNWDNKWNQTSNLDVPTDEKDMYTVPEDTWDYGNGAWSVFGGDAPEMPEPLPSVWGIVGQGSFVGEGTSWADNEHLLFKVDEEDATKAKLTVTFAVGDKFKFKFVGSDWNESFGSTLSAKYSNLFSVSGTDAVVKQAGEITFVISATAMTDINGLTADGVTILGQEAEEVVQAWGIVGNINGVENWDVVTPFTDEDEDDTATLDITLAVGDTFKFRHSSGWVGSYFGINEDMPEELSVYFGGTDNIEVKVAGEYTFSAAADKVITDDSSSLNWDLLTVEGPEVEPEPVHTLVGGQPLYLQVSNESFDWTSEGAKFGFYYYNDSAHAWSADFLTEVKGASTKIYEDVVPEGEWTKVIAVRFNAEATEFKWNTGLEGEGDFKNVWNQSVNLTVIENMNVVSVSTYGESGAACPATAETYFTSTSRAYCWANHLLATVECDGAGTNTATEEIWLDLNAQYDAMHTDAKTILKETEVTTPREDITDDLEKALDRYDYLVAKYAVSKAWMEDFLDRVEVTGANRLMTSLTNNNNMVMIIVISSVVAVLGVSVFFIYRRKRNVQ